jgi:hypothetical protein
MKQATVDKNLAVKTWSTYKVLVITIQVSKVTSANFQFGIIKFYMMNLICHVTENDNFYNTEQHISYNY